MLPDIIKPLTQNMPELFAAITEITLQLLPVLLQALDSLIQQIVAALPEILQVLWDSLTVLLDPAARIMADWWIKIEKSVKDAWGSLKKTFSELGTKIGDTVGGAIKGAVNGALEFIEKRINAVPDAINAAIDLINKLPGVEIQPMEHIQLPRLANGGVVSKPTVAQIGENGREAIIPLEKNKAGLREIAQMLAQEISSLQVSAPQNTTNHITNQGTTINFTQNNTSPKTLSQYEIWRQTRNLLQLVKAQGV